MIARLIKRAATRGKAAGPTRTVLRGEVPYIGNLTGVTETLTAKHLDPIMDEGLHQHTWTITAYWTSTPRRDGRALKMSLRVLLDQLPQNGVLPDELWSGEAIAERVLLLQGCVGVKVTRPEGFEAWADKPRAALETALGVNGEGGGGG